MIYLTKETAPTIKAITKKVAPLIDFDDSSLNGLNQIKIFQSLTLDEIGFIQNLDYKRTIPIDISDIDNDTYQAIQLYQIVKLMSDIYYWWALTEDNVLELVKTVSPYIEKMPNNQKYINDFIDMSKAIRNNRARNKETTECMREFQKQFFEYYYSNFDALTNIKDPELKALIFDAKFDVLNELNTSVNTDSLDNYFAQTINRDMTAKSNTVHEHLNKLLYNETTDQLYTTLVQESFTNKNKINRNCSLIANLNIVIPLKAPELLSNLEYYTMLWLQYIVSDYNATLPNTDLYNKLAQLLYLQTKDRLQNNTKNSNVATDYSKNLSDSMKKFISTFNPSIDNINPSSKMTVTYKEFREFLDDIENNRQISENMLNWLMDSAKITNGNDTDSTFVNTLLNDLNIATSLTSITDSPEAEEIANAISDSDSQFLITDVYRINNQKSNAQYGQDSKKPVQHKTLVHGTANASILTILRDGLLTRKEIRGDARNIETGLGLGNGVYFAQMNQAGKSLNYTSSNNNLRYLFVADVAYTKEKTVHHFGSNDADKDWDLIYAPAVGSFNRDELVSRYSQQIELKYLIAINLN